MPVSRSRRTTKSSASKRKSSTSGKNPKSGEGRRPAPARQPRGARAVALGVLVLLLVGAIVASVASLGGGGGGTSADGSGGNGNGGGRVEPLPSDHPAVQLARREAGDPLAMGPVDAPVVMIEYVDFQDAYAGIFARDTQPELVREYVERGTLRIEFRNYPIYGPESDNAARAAWAAGQQGRFWEFYEVALGEGFDRDSGRFEGRSLRRLAERAGVPDVERFLREMDARAAGRAVGRDAEEAYGLGITATPAFLVNGHPIQGARPIGEFRDTIDQLRQAEQDEQE